VPLITTRFRGCCTVCGKTIKAGEDAFFGDKKLICTGCSDIVEIAKAASGPIASALQFRGTSIEVVRQLRSVAQHLAASLRTSAKEAEALALGLQQIEDQQTEKR
jgi:hypothetical protein